MTSSTSKSDPMSESVTYSYSDESSSSSSSGTTTFISFGFGLAGAAATVGFFVVVTTGTFTSRDCNFVAGLASPFVTLAAGDGDLAAGEVDFVAGDVFDAAVGVVLAAVFVSFDDVDVAFFFHDGVVVGFGSSFTQDGRNTVRPAAFVAGLSVVVVFKPPIGIDHCKRVIKSEIENMKHVTDATNHITQMCASTFGSHFTFVYSLIDNQFAL